MGRRLTPLPLLIAAALLWPASSIAATGSLTGGVMNYTAGNGESNSVTFQFVDDGLGNVNFQVVDQPSVVIVPSAPCFLDGGQQNVMDCPQDGGFTNVPVTQFTASLGDGDDSISITTGLVPTSIGAGGGNDVMNGGPAADALRGGQGGDQITGGAGNDQLVGDDPNVVGGGDDTIDGGDGNDTEDGQDGADIVRGAQGDDTLSGGGGNDVFPAEATADGTDVLNGGDGVDTATYAARTDPLQLSLDDQPNDGQTTSATDNVHSDVENLVGGSAADSISGSDQANTLDGGAGDDAIAGLAGDDSIPGSTGNDTESGGDGNDSEAGGDGNDVLAGDAGDDFVTGSNGNDVVSGGPGNDTVAGDPGDDTLDGGPGADLFGGGFDNDTVDYSSRSNGVNVTLDDQANDGEPAEGDNVQTDVENVRGGTGADTLTGDAAGNTLDGGDGEDYSDGGAGSDTLVGGAAGDVLRTRGSAEPDTITCGPGPDFVVAKPGDTIAPDCDRADRGVNQKPRRRDSALVAPVTGTLQMSPAGIVRRVPLQDKVVLPLRSIVDTLAGSVKVTTAPTARKTQAVALEDGAFDITQSAGNLSVTQFALQGGDFGVCSAAGRKASTSATRKSSTKTVRTLWANGKGNFRTKGRYAAATIRGTRWQTVDRCDGTLIKVNKGAVTVRDLVKKTTVVVKAGGQYLAKS